MMDVQADPEMAHATQRKLVISLFNVGIHSSPNKFKVGIYSK